MKTLTQIAREIYFSGLGNINWKEVQAKYKLSKAELDYITSIIRNQG